MEGQGQQLNKSCSYHEDMCPEPPNSCQDDPLSSHTPTPGFMERGHLDRENDKSIQRIHFAQMSKTYLKVTATVMKHDVQAILPSVIWNNDKFFLAALEVCMKFQ